MSTWTIGPRRLVSAFFVAATTLPTQVFAQDPALTPPVPPGADAVLERLRQMEERLDAMSRQNEQLSCENQQLADQYNRLNHQAQTASSGGSESKSKAETGLGVPGGGASSSGDGEGPKRRSSSGGGDSSGTSGGGSKSVGRRPDQLGDKPRSWATATSASWT